MDLIKDELIFHSMFYCKLKEIKFRKISMWLFDCRRIVNDFDSVCIPRAQRWKLNQSEFSLETGRWKIVATD